jgi:hypothetical protein
MKSGRVFRFSVQRRLKFRVGSFYEANDGKNVSAGILEEQVTHGHIIFYNASAMIKYEIIPSHCPFQFQVCKFNIVALKA